MRLAVVGLLVSGLMFGGCTSEPAEDQLPGPQGAAERLAGALTSGDFSLVRLGSTPTEGVERAYADVVADLVDLPHEARAGEARVDQPSSASGEIPTASAVLTWSWTVGDQSWAYDVPVQFSLAEDQWQVEWSPALVEPSLAEGEVLELSSITPDRGDVIGAGGLALVTEREVSRVGIDKPSLTGNPAEAARALARLVDIDPAAYVEQVKAAGDKAFVEAIVYRAEDMTVPIVQGVRRIDGARIVAGTLPLAPTRDFAAPILGRVGEVTAEMIEENPEVYRVGDVAGLSGLQARYDDSLRGIPGRAISAVTPEGEERELFRADPVDGAELRLTLDVDLQIEAERLLADVGPASALVALRPSTGEIVAAANGPGNGGLNLATYGQFAPGSTFKTVSSLALLRAGLTPDSTVPCTASITVDGKRFTNYSDYPASGIGRIPLRTALANSCNTAFISQAERLGETGLFDAGVSLGIGLDHDLGFPAYLGSVEPSKAETEAAAQMIGQGTILASPMVMAAVIGTVQAGELVIPNLVGGVDFSAPDGLDPITPAEDADLKAMLRGVVTDGSGRGLLDLPGPPVIAKTGTAEFGAGEGLQTHAWMIAAQGDLAVAVFVEVGESGSRTAGPILEAFLRAAR